MNCLKEIDNIAEVKSHLTTLCQNSNWSSDCLTVNPYLIFGIPIILCLLGIFIPIIFSILQSTKKDLATANVDIHIARLDPITRKFIVVSLTNKAVTDFKFSSIIVINSETKEIYNSDVIIKCKENPTITELREYVTSPGAILCLSSNVRSTLVIVSKIGETFPNVKLTLILNGYKQESIQELPDIDPPNLGIIAGVTLVPV